MKTKGNCVQQKVENFVVNLNADHKKVCACTLVRYENLISFNFILITFFPLACVKDNVANWAGTTKPLSNQTQRKLILKNLVVNSRALQNNYWNGRQIAGLPKIIFGIITSVLESVLRATFQHKTFWLLISTFFDCFFFGFHCYI